jgi:hypothetical protein
MRVTAVIARDKPQVATPAEETPTVTGVWIICHRRRKSDERRKEVVTQK